MSRRVRATDGEAGVRLPRGWVLDAGDEVVIPDSEWDQISADTNLATRLDDLGFTSATPDDVPTFRDMQRALSSSDTGLGNQIDTLSSSLSSHTGDTTNVHGISDTALLETQSGAQTKADLAEAAAQTALNTHAGDTTNVHGIADTSKLGWLNNADVLGTEAEGTVLTKVGTGYEFAPADSLVWEQTFNFAVASDAWAIPHGQGTYAVHIEVFDASGNPMEGNVLFLDPDNAVVEYYYPQSGYVRAWTLT